LAWKTEISNTAKKQLQKLDHQVQKNILDYLEKRIATDKDPKRGPAEEPPKVLS